jgi:hypothetical protein
MEPIVIDCATCIARDTATCADCVVTFVCSRPPGEALVMELADYRALQVLGDAGLVPTLRHEQRAPS